MDANEARAAETAGPVGEDGRVEAEEMDGDSDGGDSRQQG